MLESEYAITCKENLLLTDIIKQKIGEQGPISFHDFMEMALYYPGLGYYTSVQDKIGANGDFYTSPNLTPAFGAAIARQIEQMWDILGSKNFTIVEYGAGTGMLCRDILDYFKCNRTLYDHLDYCIIEKSPSMRQKEQELLSEKVKWYHSTRGIANLTGCILSNELLDNFSVHQVVMEDELMEVFVDYENGFIELLRPAAAALKNYLKEQNVVLPKGFRTEINLEAVKWIAEVAASIKRGYVITIDYGYPSNELYHERRSQGTMVCYHKHTISENPFDEIGKQDITSHVNFSALCHWGFKHGLACCGLATQAAFLLSLGIKELLRKFSNDHGDPLKIARKEAMLTYTLLVDMGIKYKVLIQRKGVSANKLAGLNFS
jgi:SAM-dependent MidA family methyltransferase